MQKTFAHFDTDNDGFITQEELSSMAKEKGFEYDASAVSSMMLEVDLNADGRIDFQEVRLLNPVLLMTQHMVALLRPTHRHACTKEKRVIDMLVSVHVRAASLCSITQIVWGARAPGRMPHYPELPLVAGISGSATCTSELASQAGSCNFTIAQMWPAGLACMLVSSKG